MKKGVLLINLGTPDSPDTGDVRRYLREFLSDNRVIDIHPIARWLLLNLIILPFRPAKSGAAYRKVWRAEGSPLLYFSQLQQRQLQQRLPDRRVILAMRYGRPSIADALAGFKKEAVDLITVIPLYPQYSSAATGSSLEKVMAELRPSATMPWLTVVPPFYDDPRFIGAFADVARPLLADFRPDHLLFSYHGLPERHVKASDDTGAHCLASDNCCAAIGIANRNCYRAQSYATTRSLISAISPAGTLPHSTSFQSRLGSTPWIKPYTDLELPMLVKQGVKRLAVMCPSFVADCLETLEEIGIRAREDFRAAGGEELLLIPSLNAEPSWLTALEQIVRDRD